VKSSCQRCRQLLTRVIRRLHKRSAPKSVRQANTAIRCTCLDVRLGIGILDIMRLHRRAEPFYQNRALLWKYLKFMRTLALLRQRSMRLLWVCRRVVSRR